MFLISMSAHKMHRFNTQSCLNVVTVVRRQWYKNAATFTILYTKEYIMKSDWQKDWSHSSLATTNVVFYLSHVHITSTIKIKSSEFE